MSDVPCLSPGCPVLVRSGRCRAHAREYEHSRPNLAIRRLYRTSRWKRLRASILLETPICVHCRPAGTVGLGVVEAATDVDHVVPHHGDLGRFWSRDNLQALCHRCHSAKTADGR